MPPPHPLRISARVVYLDSTVQLQKLPRVAERHAELRAVLACSVFSAVPDLRKFANWAPAVQCSLRGSNQRDSRKVNAEQQPAMTEAKISLHPSQNVQPAFYVRLEPPAKEIRLFSRRGPAAGASPCLRYAVPVDLCYVDSVAK